MACIQHISSLEYVLFMYFEHSCRAQHFNIVQLFSFPEKYFKQANRIFVETVTICKY